MRLKQDQSVLLHLGGQLYYITDPQRTVIQTPGLGNDIVCFMLCEPARGSVRNRTVT